MSGWFSLPRRRGEDPQLSVYAKSAALWLIDGRVWLWIAWVILFVVWLSTVFHPPVGENHYLSSIVLVLLLSILYFAEGMELAVTDLLDKEEEQFSVPNAREVLRAIRKNAEWFFAQRQLFVVAIISWMSLITSYSQIYVPFVGRVSEVKIVLLGQILSVDLPFWFSLAFTTFTVLWWCQVAPKRLAIRNSEKFLQQSAFLWGPMKFIGLLNLPGPADAIVSFARRYTNYRNPRHLRPSRPAYYNHAVMLYGFSLDRVSAELTIRADGSAVVKQRYLVLFVHGRRTSTFGFAEAETAFEGAPTLALRAIYTCNIPENLEQISGQLDQIFEGETPSSNEHEFSGNLSASFAHEFNISEGNPKISGAKGQEVSWTLRWGRPLPENFWEASSSDQQGVKRKLVAVIYEADSNISAGAYRLDDDDEHIWYGDLPCRAFSLSVKPDESTHFEFWIQQCNVSLRNREVPFPVEQERCDVLTMLAKDHVKLMYPLPGTLYQFRWTPITKNQAAAVKLSAPTAPTRVAEGGG